ncbi:hypothetical protein [Thiolapillus sp.]
MIGIDELQETPEGLLLRPSPRERRKNLALMVALALIPAAIALGSAWRSPRDDSGLFWGSLLTLLMLAWGLVFTRRWAELRLDRNRQRIRHQVHHWGNRRVRRRDIAFSEVSTLRVQKRERLGYSTPEPYGRLQILDRAGNIWASLDFESLQTARRARRKILACLETSRPKAGAKTGSGR